MSTQAQSRAARKLSVHVDEHGGFHVIQLGEALPKPAAISLREQTERQAARLRQQAVDEAAVQVGRWTLSMAALCAAALRRGEAEGRGAPRETYVSS
ncbi:hypothetical protein EZ313_00635 [Ramlibacter henchirensis]|uniref:Uncharacterized protein n=1 Tax=Ramlibacter henchirensis TaxID=204072 RepID=A0A4Z0C533_9BURK|nr:hypothetical protein [Ramlibacter henchirensis]TFZ05219.1 hypothetical protein EZ313_00635 [Ramlibacter henchirensis]